LRRERKDLVNVPFAIRSTLRLSLAFSLIAAGIWVGSLGFRAGGSPDQISKEQFRKTLHPALDLPAQSFTPCVDGFAGQYPCNSIDLMSFLPLAQIGGGNGSDIEGWTDPRTGNEYAIMGRSNGTAFVDITDPVNPVYLGNLPTRTISSSWREIGVYKNYALIVCDYCETHGMQIFDLRQLRNVPNPPVTFSETVLYTAFATSHTISINRKTGFAYADGSNTCSGGPHMIDIHDPLHPVFAGCYSEDGYTHDAQCVIYQGPDAEHQGQEICFLANVDTVTIVDVTDKANPTMISRTTYPGLGFTHQGWLTKDQATFILDDELDEVFIGHKTKTRFFDVRDLEAPFVASTYLATTKAIDHNQYVRGNLVFQSNYQAGLRILNLRPAPAEVAYFDVYPLGDQPDFNGTWANYPFFRSGNVVISGIEEGLFVVHPTLP
jgi:choice-of-anchor B domain-containing protein